MTGSSHIQYLTRSQIDTAKWDHCIKEAGNGLIYASSFYLDQMADNWDALVLGEYEAVMPLPWKKKYGIHYLTQPFLAAQLGVFGKNISSSILESFLKIIPSKFKFWDIYLNHGNVFPIETFKLYNRSNYILDLTRPYADLYGAYRENTQRNLKKSTEAGCTVQKNFDAEKVIVLAVQQMKTQSGESTDHIARFRKLYQQLQNKQMATTYGILSAKNELVASAIFFFSHQRAYYILVGNHPNGKTIGASHALVDAFISEHAGKNIKLDFEGSDIPNLAHFYSGFGAVEEKYAAIKLNRLPWWLKWLKK